MKITIPQIRTGPDADRNIIAILDILNDVHDVGPGILVLPESSFTGYGIAAIPAQSSRDEWLSRLSDFARDSGSHVYTGSWPELSASSGTCVQVARLIGPDGIEMGRVEREILPDGSTMTGSDFPVIKTAIGTLGLVLGPDFWLIEPARIQCLKGAELLVVAGAITGRRRSAQRSAVWGISTLNTVGVAFSGSLGAHAHGGSAIAMPEGFVAQAYEEETVLQAEWDPTRISRIREPDLKFQQTMWFGLWARRPDLYGLLVDPSPLETEGVT